MKETDIGLRLLREMTLGLLLATPGGEGTGVPVELEGVEVGGSWVTNTVVVTVT